MPKISIIIPIYNVEQYLEKCMDTIINQTLKDIEIICVDDGSTDSSNIILQKYKLIDKRIKIIKQDNQGLGAARNTGMNIATGDYIGFVDADDWIDEDFYEKLYYRAIKKDADIVRSTYKYVSETFLKDSEINKLLKEKYLNDELLNPNEHSVIVWNSIYKTEFLKQKNIMYFDNINCAEDISFTARTSFEANKIVSVYDTYYYYRQSRKGQLSIISLEKIFAQLKTNKIATIFFNSKFDHIKKEDYKNAYMRCCCRLDDLFKKGLKIRIFNKKEQEIYIKEVIDIINSFKLEKSIIATEYPNLIPLIKNDIKAYKKQYLKKKILKFFSINNEYNNNIKRKIIKFLGIKISLKVR